MTIEDENEALVPVLDVLGEEYSYNSCLGGIEISPDVMIYAYRDGFVVAEWHVLRHATYWEPAEGDWVDVCETADAAEAVAFAKERATHPL